MRMLTEIWNSGIWGRVLMNSLGAISVLVALYLLLIAYRKLVIFYGRGKKKRITAIYADIFELKPPYAKGTVQFGFELKEATKVKFSIVDTNDNEIHVLCNDELEKGVHPFLFDSTNYLNGLYYYQYRSDLQRVAKKFIIEN